MAASAKSTIVGLTSKEYDRTDLPTLRAWARYWNRVAEGKRDRNEKDANADAKVELKKLAKEIGARETARAAKA